MIVCTYCLTFGPKELLFDFISLLIVLILSLLFLLLVSIILVKIVVVFFIFRFLPAFLFMVLRFALHHSIILCELLQDLGVASSFP